MICAVENDVECPIHVAVLNPHTAFVGVDVNLKVLNTSRIHKFSVLGRDFLRDEGSRKVSRWCSTVLKTQRRKASDMMVFSCKLFKKSKFLACG